MQFTNLATEPRLTPKREKKKRDVKVLSPPLAVEVKQSQRVTQSTSDQHRTNTGPTPDHRLRSRHYLNVVIAGKHPAPQWLTMAEAVKRLGQPGDTWPRDCGCHLDWSCATVAEAMGFAFPNGKTA